MSESTPAASLAQVWAQNPTLVIFQLVGWLVLLVWTYTWKGFALWRAAQKKDKIWFIILLVVGFQTFGLLDLMYFAYLSTLEWDKLLSKFGIHVATQTVSDQKAADTSATPSTPPKTTKKKKKKKNPPQKVVKSSTK